MALFSAGSSHICHLVASVSNVQPTCLPGTHPPAVSPKALFLVHYSSSCRPYTTPLSRPTLISSCSLNYHLYTHMTLSSFFPSFRLTSTPAYTVDHLHNALDQISSWMTANILTLNSSMTEFLLIGLSKQLAKINSSLTTIHSARKLGFIFDEHLTFSDQFSSVSIGKGLQIRCVYNI